MGPRLVWRDLCRSVRGAGAFLRYLRSQDTIDIALGRFEAASSTVVPGRPCRYVIRVANVSERVRNVKLTLEMGSMTAAEVPAQPCTSFAKHCTVLPRRAVEIECDYDWGAAVVFLVDGVASPPDEWWKGEINPMQRYVVRAILSDQTGRPLDTLAIYQELQG